jgi:hypothetical protein
MPQKHFTANRVRSLAFVPGHGNQTLYQDDETPGLGVRVTAAGVRSYIFETTLHGKTVRETIGDIKTWTLVKARAEATKFKTLTDQGIHPRKVRDEQLAIAEADRVRQATESVLVGEVWTAYLEHHAIYAIIVITLNPVERRRSAVRASRARGSSTRSCATAW